LVPTHNEEKIIEHKLENIKSTIQLYNNYEVIVVDDASEDATLENVKCFMEKNPDLNLRIIGQNLHVGKSAVLNRAIDSCTGEVIIVTDADTFWPSDILQKALPYLSDPSVGAITGRGVNRNKFRSWVTKSEDIYLQLTSMLRLGESKIHSTIRFEGGFCAYKRKSFEKFDCETGSDDSGTALEVVQNGFRAIMVPEAVFYTDFPLNISSKVKIKFRRANQLIGLWIKCLKLMIKGELHLPKKIAMPEVMLFIINPLIFMALIFTTFLVVALSPLSYFTLSLVALVTVLLIFAKEVFIEALLDNLILFCALLSFIFGLRYMAWARPY
jgi:cellulose synthase/poly-beta-1,6-N-acetylglucosamine synthase-like glycosyltransferase